MTRCRGLLLTGEQSCLIVQRKTFAYSKVKGTRGRKSWSGAGQSFGMTGVGCAAFSKSSKSFGQT